MLRRIWQWFKGIFRRLLGVGTPPQSSHYPGERASLGSPPDSGGDFRERRLQVVETPPLEDSDYEYLFRQLLEGVAHGWQQTRVLKFFEGLKGRITNAEWVAWLEGFGEKVLASRTANHELARRMVQLGEITQSIPSIRDIGAAAYKIGSEVLTREHTGIVWEYDGPDADPRTPAIQGEEPINQPVPGSEVITVDELFERLQQDANLCQLVAQQLGIETTDPQVIIQELINQQNAAGR